MPKAPKKSTEEHEEALHNELLICAKQKQCSEIEPGIKGRLLCANLGDKDTWGSLACTLSLNLPGQFWVGSASICWVNGGATPLGITAKNRLESIIEAREITRALTGYPDKKIGCSVSNNARKMLEWVNIRQLDARALDKIGVQDKWAYQYCNPIDLPQAYLHDITSCYFSLMQRAPTPRVILLRDKLHFCPYENREEEQRWKAMLSAAKDHKGLRNSFVGQMYARSNGLYYCNGIPNQEEGHIDFKRTEDGTKFYRTGLQLEQMAAIPDSKEKRLELIKKQAKPGPLRPLAALIVRSATELCYLARVEEEAYYSNTDCVISPHPTSPRIWQEFGLKVTLKASGPTNIHALGYYRVGDDPEHGHTKPFLKDQNSPVKPRVEHNVTVGLSGKFWCGEWLKPGEDWKPDPEILKKDKEQRESLENLRAIAKNAALQGQIRRDERAKQAREAKELQEYADKVSEAF